MVFKPLQDFLDYLDLKNINRIPNMSPTDPFAIVSIILLLSVPIIALVILGVVSRRSAQSVKAGIVNERRYRILRRMARKSMLNRDLGLQWDECGIPYTPNTPRIPTTPCTPASLSFPAPVPARKPVPLKYLRLQPAPKIRPAPRHLAPISVAYPPRKYEKVQYTPGSATPLLATHKTEARKTLDPAADFVEIYDRWQAHRQSLPTDSKISVVKNKQRRSEISKPLEIVPLRIVKMSKQNCTT